MWIPGTIGRSVAAFVVISTLVIGCGSGGGSGGEGPGPASTIPRGTPNTSDTGATETATATVAAAAPGSATPASPAESASPAGRPPLRVVAIGDSLAQASSCRGCVDYVDRYGQALAQSLGRPVDVDNRAAIQLSALPPVQAGQLLNDMLVDPSLRASIRSADAVIVNVGFNDTPWNRFDNPCDASNLAATIVDWARIDAACISRVANEYAQTLDQILSQIDELRGCARPPDQPVDFCAAVGRPVTAIRVVSVFDDWIGEPGLSRQGVNATRAADLAFLKAQCWVAEIHGARCADVLHAFNGAQVLGDAKAYLVDDHTHLNQAGHDRVAAVLAQLGFDPLR